MRKILCKIFLDYIDIAIFALGYFILPHPVHYCINSVERHQLNASKASLL